MRKNLHKWVVKVLQIAGGVVYHPWHRLCSRPAQDRWNRDEHC